jgi:Carboxypeptidase regulatory-like domain
MLKRIVLTAALGLTTMSGLAVTSSSAFGVPNGTISGQVSDLQGNPVSNVTVWAFGPHGRVVTTDAAGRYTIGGLGASSFVVCFDPHQAVDAPPTGYLPECYDGIPWEGIGYAPPSGTSPVTVTSGGTTSGIDAALTPAAVISGTVTDPQGHRVRGTTVSIYSPSGVIRIATSDSAGAYRSGALPAAEYLVCFSARADRVAYPSGLLPQCYSGQPWSGEGPPSAGATPVDTQPGVETSGIDASLALGAGFAGRVTDASTGVGIGGLQVEVFDAQQRLVSTNVTNERGPAAEAGTYSVSRLVPGTYTVCFDGQFVGLRGGYGYQSQCYAGRPWNAVDTQLPSGRIRMWVRSGQLRLHTDAELAPGGELTGAVTGPDGSRAYGVTVSVLDDAGELVGQTVVQFGSYSYALPGLPPSAGGYAVCFDTSTSNRPHLQSECYNGQPWNGNPGSVPSSASLVPITVTTSTSGIDATLHMAA